MAIFLIMNWLVEQNTDHAVVLCEPNRVLTHHLKNCTFTFPHWLIELFSFTDWYTVAMEVRDGNVGTMYCNIVQPAVQYKDVISFVDMAVDVFKSAQGNWEVLDYDEFEENGIRLAYPAELISRVEQELDNLLHRINTLEFPFDGSLEQYVSCIAYYTT